MADDQPKIRVNTPDGKVATFPLGTPKEVIQRTLERHFPPKVQALEPITVTPGDTPPVPDVRGDMLSDDPRDWEMARRPPAPWNPEAAAGKGTGPLSSKATPGGPGSSMSLLNIGQDIWEGVKHAMAGRDPESHPWIGSMSDPDVVSPKDIFALGSLSPASPGMQTSRQAYARANEVLKAGPPRWWATPAEERADAYIAKRATERPRFAGPDKTATLEAADRIGATALPKAAVSGIVGQQVAGGLTATPLGIPLFSASKKTLQQLESAKNAVVDRIGGGTRVSAGTDIKDEVTAWIEAGSQAEATTLYKPVDDAIAAAAKAPGASYTDPKNPHITNVFYKVLGRDPDTGEIGETGKVISNLLEEFGAMRQKPPPLIDQMGQAIESDAKFDFKTLQRLRNRVGDMLSGKIKGLTDYDERVTRAIYKALSKDLEDLAVDALGRTMPEPDAKLLWQRINREYAEMIQGKREALGKLVGLKGDVSAEGVIDRIRTMSSAGKGGDIERLKAIKSVLYEPTWRNIGAAIIRDMGTVRETDGLGMSIVNFRNEWETRLSEEAKNLLFDPAHKQALDDIALVGQSAEGLMRWGNPSGTTRGLTITAAVYSMWGHPFIAAGSAVGNLGLAWLMSRPVGAAKLSNYLNRYIDAALNVGSDKLRLLSKDNPSEWLIPLKQAEQELMQEAALPAPTPDQAMRYPKGTIIRTPDGELRRVR